MGRRSSMPLRGIPHPRPVSARRLPLHPRPATLRPRLGLPVPPLERPTSYSNSADREAKLCLVNVDELNHAIQQAVQQQVVVQMQVLKPTLAGLAATDTEPTPLKMSGYEVLMDPGQNPIVIANVAVNKEYGDLPKLSVASDTLNTPRSTSSSCPSSQSGTSKMSTGTVVSGEL